MSTTVKLLEIEDTTTDSQYGMGLRNTAHAFVEALKVFDDAKRADRKDWKLKAEHKGDKCFNKHFPIGKVYYLKKTYNIDMETLFQHHWNENGTSRMVPSKLPQAWCSKGLRQKRGGELDGDDAIEVDHCQLQSDCSEVSERRTSGLDRSP
ncbi:hypothetical protein RB195_006439 [Necator americanus]|uniref:Uncharacterized protein n=1 Tax=Necator americanus TaxID=51031 RepID=A0ABR1BSL5_NECAM